MTEGGRLNALILRAVWAAYRRRNDPCFVRLAGKWKTGPDGKKVRVRPWTDLRVEPDNERARWLMAQTIAEARKELRGALGVSEESPDDALGGMNARKARQAFKDACAAAHHVPEHAAAGANVSGDDWIPHVDPGQSAAHLEAEAADLRRLLERVDLVVQMVLPRNARRAKLLLRIIDLYESWPPGGSLPTMADISRRLGLHKDRTRQLLQELREIIAARDAA